MGIISRFGDIMRSNINAILDKAEDPAKMVDQLLLDMREKLAKVTQETAGVMAVEKQAKRTMDECEAEIRKYERAAMNAVAAGDDDDARRYLTWKQSLETTLAGHRMAYEAAHENSEKMRQMHDKLVDDIRKCEQRKAMVKAQVAAARAQQSVNDAVRSMSSDESQSAFARMEVKAAGMLDRAEAEAELATGCRSDEIAAKHLGGASGTVEDELARMKARLAGGGDLS